MGSGSVGEFLHCLIKGMLRRGTTVELRSTRQPKAAVRKCYSESRRRQSTTLEC